MPLRITPSVAEQEGQQTETEATGAPQKHHYTLNQQVGSITDFAYQIKGINNQKEDGFNVTIRAATAQEKKHISELIESAAENAYNIIIGSEVNEDEKS
ncbi:hypothetical protein [Klebsiella pneumoniae]|uniref:hypothetical protein n=1 Tax=Klebsiella pneumoniae TaxID=573 RepID=UPI0030E5E0C3